jgi:hypothetical protein
MTQSDQNIQSDFSPQQMPDEPLLRGKPDALRVGTIWTCDLRQNLDVTAATDIVMLPQVTFRRSGQESIEPLAQAVAAETTSAILSIVRTELDQRLATGRRCYTAWVGNQPAAYGWVSLVDEEVGELGLHLVLQPGEIYIWDCYTFPAYRQKRLYSALLVFILQKLKTEGFHRAWIGADLANTPSQRGIDRAGFMRVADLLVKQDVDERRIWAEGYPGVPGMLIAASERLYLGSR